MFLFVVLENIDRHLQMGKNATKAALDAALEVATPVLASTLVIIVVFIPTLFLTGIAKDLFSPLAITVAGAMLGSYIFSLTLIPITAANLFKNKLPSTAEKEKTGFRKTVEKWRISYQESLEKALQKRIFIQQRNML